MRKWKGPQIPRSLLHSMYEVHTEGGGYDKEQGGQWKPGTTVETAFQGVVMPLNNEDLQYIDSGSYKHEYMKNGICGDGNFIDNVLGADYITHQIRENLYKIFIANKKIAYTDDGFALVAAGVFAALNRAVELHIIATDPEDDTGVYTVVIPKRADATDEQARNRQMPDIKWSAQLEGAVHSVKVNGTLRVTLNG